MVEGYQDGAKEMGVELDVQYSNNNVEEETRLTEAFISQGSSGVIVNPIDSVAIAGPIQKAKNAGKHIVLTDVTPARNTDRPCRLLLHCIWNRSINKKGGSVFLLYTKGYRNERKKKVPQDALVALLVLN